MGYFTITFTMVAMKSVPGNRNSLALSNGCTMKISIALLCLTVFPGLSSTAGISRMVFDEESPAQLLVLYERVAGVKVERDASLDSAHGWVSFDTAENLSREDAAVMIAAALKNQAGIVLTRIDDSTALASYDPQQPLTPPRNAVWQVVGDLDLVLRVKEKAGGSHLAISGVLDRASYERLDGRLSSASRERAGAIDLDGIEIISAEEYAKLRDGYRSLREEEMRARILESRNSQR